MADLKFSFYRCGQHLSGDESLSGTQIQCPTCQALLLIPFLRNAPEARAPGTSMETEWPAPARSKGAFLSITNLVLAVLAVAVSILTSVTDLKRREVRRVLASLGSVYDRMTSYDDKAFITQEVEIEGKKRLIEMSASLALQKPDKVNLKIKSERGEVQMVCDGRISSTFVSIFENQYVTRGAEPLPDLFRDLLNRSWLGVQGALDYYTLVIAGLSQKYFSTDAKNLKVIGREWVNGKPAYVVTWEMERGPLRFLVKAWVSRENGLILKMVENFTVVASELAKLGPYTVVNTNLLKVTTVLQDVRRDQSIPEERFVFKAPAATQKVECFQLKTLLSLKGGPPIPESVLLRLIAPRPHPAKSGTLDLTTHYNAPLVLSWHSGNGNDLSPLPAGLQRFAGIDFDVRGIIQLSGGEALVRYPEAVKGIKVGFKSQRLHFLHASGWSVPEYGAKIGAYRIHYSNGEHDEIPILYGKDVVDWWNWSPKLPTDSVVAWTGQNAASRVGGRLIRLFKSTWINPHPEIKIESIDFVSGLLNAAPFLVAISADQDPRATVARLQNFSLPWGDWRRRSSLALLSTGKNFQDPATTYETSP